MATLSPSRLRRLRTANGASRPLGVAGYGGGSGGL